MTKKKRRFPLLWRAWTGLAIVLGLALALGSLRAKENPVEWQAAIPPLPPQVVAHAPVEESPVPAVPQPIVAEEVSPPTQSPAVALVPPVPAPQAQPQQAIRPPQQQTAPRARSDEGLREWRRVGSHPCHGICTAEASLRQSNFPPDVQGAFLAQVVAGRHEVVPMTSFYRGSQFNWVTFGRDRRLAISYDVVAAWDSSEGYTARHYQVSMHGRLWHLYQIVECGNWVGIIGVDNVGCPPGTPNCPRRAAN